MSDENKEGKIAAVDEAHPQRIGAAAEEARRAVSELLTRLNEPGPAGAGGAPPRLFPHGITSISVDVSIGIATPTVGLKVAVSGPEKPGAMETGRETAEPQATRNVSFQIRRHTSASLTDARADRILADSTALLRTVDGAGDVSADVRLTRSGSVGTFAAGNGIINSAADYAQVCAQATGQRALIVNQILYCGGDRPNPGFIFIGCADTPGTCMVLVRTDADEEPVLWAHEYGHNCGLGHRNVEFAVMHGTVAVNRRRINGAERNAYEGRPSFAAMAGTGDPQPMQKAVDVREFVLQRYIHGIPRALATEFSPRVIPDLLTMLGDREYERYWANIVSTLCMIGDPAAAEPVQEFLLAGEGVLSRDEYDAKCMALMNLGRLVRRAGVENAPLAFDTLREAVEPVALPRDIRWTNPYGLEEDAQRVQVAKMAAWGLALTGSAAAEEALRGVSQAESVTSMLEVTDSTRSQSLPDLIGEALEFQASGRE